MANYMIDDKKNLVEHQESTGGGGNIIKRYSSYTVTTTVEENGKVISFAGMASDYSGFISHIEENTILINMYGSIFNSSGIPKAPISFFKNEGVFTAFGNAMVGMIPVDITIVAGDSFFTGELRIIDRISSTFDSGIAGTKTIKFDIYLES